ncbi:type VII secretion target [Streptomyces sp. NPDC002574]|uniref:type VII secretion target n=1 Tax=Streptomyces sp. NPDC002574 TaxID=3364652 RepID=UPI0036B55D2B
MTRDVDIDTPAVRRTGDDMEALSRSATGRLGHALDSSQDLPYSAYGWRSAEELRACATAWEDHMVELAKRMNTLAHRLRDSADGYDAADAEAESRLRAGLTELGKA